jgi:hypothetical protein
MNPAIEFIKEVKKALSRLIALWANGTMGVALLLGIGMTSAQANDHSAELALAQLLKDVEKIDRVLTVEAESTEAGYYTIQRGDTLDRIIDRVVPKTSLRRSILRQAIVRANPHAFKRSNPNWMYANKRIRLPNGEDIKAVIFTASAVDNSKGAGGKDKADWVRYP